jgi:copper ion binding protein
LQKEGTGMKKIIINVGGMSCQHCTKAVEQALKGVKGVRSVSVDLAHARAVVEYDESIFQLKDAELAISEQGYDFLGTQPSD